MTNLEKIRAMSAEELAEAICVLTNICMNGKCKDCPLFKSCYTTKSVVKYLLSEVEEC